MLIPAPTTPARTAFAKRPASATREGTDGEHGGIEGACCEVGQETGASRIFLRHLVLDCESLEEFSVCGRRCTLQQFHLILKARLTPVVNDWL